MSKLNQNRVIFFGLGVVFGGWVLKMFTRAIQAGSAR